MKICDKCGALNSDSRAFCVDCNEKLGNPVSPREQKSIEREINAGMETMYNRNDPLYVSPFDKAMGVISLVGIGVSLAFWAVGLFLKLDFGFLWLGILFFALAAVEALYPKLTWTIEKLRLSFTVNNPDDAEPSAFYKVCRKVCIVLFALLGIVWLVAVVYEFTLI